MTATPTLAQAFLLQGHTRNALKAAELTTEATVELLRFHREGNAFDELAFNDPDPVASLAEALLRTARIEQDRHVTLADAHPEDRARDGRYRSALGQLAAACAKFLEDEHSIVISDFPASLTPRKD